VRACVCVCVCVRVCTLHYFVHSVGALAASTFPGVCVYTICVFTRMRIPPPPHPPPLPLAISLPLSLCTRCTISLALHKTAAVSLLLGLFFFKYMHTLSLHPPTLFPLFSFSVCAYALHSLALSIGALVAGTVSLHRVRLTSLR